MRGFLLLSAKTLDCSGNEPLVMSPEAAVAPPPGQVSDTTKLLSPFTVQTYCAKGVLLYSYQQGENRKRSKKRRLRRFRASSYFIDFFQVIFCMKLFWI